MCRARQIHLIDGGWDVSCFRETGVQIGKNLEKSVVFWEFRLAQNEEDDETFWRTWLYPRFYFELLNEVLWLLFHNIYKLCKLFLLAYFAWLLLSLYLTRLLCYFRLLRMETSKKWRKKSDWKSANAKDVRTKTSLAETMGAPRPRRDEDVHQLRNSHPTLRNSPNKWTPSSTQSSTTEMGKEKVFILLYLLIKWHTWVEYPAEP